MMRPPDVGPLGTARRRAVAAACRDGARTRADLARMLGAEPGAIESVLRALRDAGVLEAVAVTHARGTGFVLRDEWREPLAQAVGAAQPTGVLTTGLRLVLVAANRPAALDAVMRLASSEPQVAWAARCDGPVRLIVALGLGEGSGRADRLEARIAEAGGECVQIVLDEIMDHARFVRYAGTIGDRDTALPAPVEGPEAP